MLGEVAEPEDRLGEGHQRQFEEVVVRVADLPAVQQQVAVQQVPGLQGVVPAVGHDPGGQ